MTPSNRWLYAFVALPLFACSGQKPEIQAVQAADDAPSKESDAESNSPHEGLYPTPPITIEEDGRVRVDLEDGPIWIRQCYIPEGYEGTGSLAPLLGNSLPGGVHSGVATSTGGTTFNATVGIPPSSISQASSTMGSGPVGPEELPFPRCLMCHTQIENATQHMMGLNLDCTLCHGGDEMATTKAAAHVFPNGTVTYGKTVPPMDQDLDYQRFVNPSNLRVVDQACGLCHSEIVDNVRKSMMATAAGHYAGGLFQNNVQATKTPIYGTFAVADTDGTVPIAQGAVASLDDLLIYDPNQPQGEFATHFAAVPSQACARCHLWSRGKGFRGAPNQNGVYRADGCAACHMLYANDGLSQSADTAIDHTIPGYPMKHIVTKQIPTEQCLHCHHRGARIGLSFTGRAQMPPRLPSGPGVAGTTDEKFNNNYHFTDSETNPQDIHRERGLHCIDCHVASEIMGDGNIWGHMDQATKIECRTCHGMPGVPATLKDNDNVALPNVVDFQGLVMLTSKVTGATHIVPSLDDFLSPASPGYNADAHAAMDANHIKPNGGLECYACHSSWVPNCYGCHFERDETQVGLNLMTGQYEVGKASTNNKIFESMRNFSLGPNSEGRVAPYIVGCQPMADVTDAQGNKLMEFKMPVTSNGLSGLAMDPVQPHTVRGVGEVRTCVECHRSPPSMGFGTGNYSVGRETVYTAGPTGLKRYDRNAAAGQPPVLADLPLAGTAQAMVSVPNGVEGTADYLYVAEGSAGVEVFDLTAGVPASPIHTITGVNAIDVSRVARYLYVVDQGVGIKIYDTDSPTAATLVGSVAMPNALRAKPFGIHLFVAAGSSGMQVINIADHATPTVVGSVGGIDAQAVHLYAHFQAGNDFAVRAYVADPSYGVRIIDLLPDFDSPQLVGGLPAAGALAMDTYTRYVPATATVPSREHDYLYVAAGTGGLYVFDITQPDAAVQVANVTTGGNLVDVDVCSDLAPPGVDDYAYLANTAGGMQVIDVTDPTSPTFLGTVGTGSTERVFAEVQQLDRFLDEQGNTLKENSHPFTGTFTRAQIVQMLSTTLP